MANGDDALAAGMTILSGNDDRRKGWDEINKTRDFIAQFFRASKTYADGLLAALGSMVPWSAVAPKGEASAGGIARYSDAGRLQSVGPAGVNDVATVGWVESRVGGLATYTWVETRIGGIQGVPASGGTFSGQVYFPNASPATSGYSVAYINGDGRLSRSPSAAKYKKFISDLDPAVLGDIWPQFSRYQMRSGDGSWKYGYIADQMAANADQQPFVIYAYAPDENGVSVPTDEVESIDFIGLLLSQTAQLHQAVELLLQRIEDLESRH